LALYMGVPVLNLCGNLTHTRTGADILRIANLDALIVTKIDDYIKKVVDLAQNRAKLAAFSAKISVDKLCDTKNFVDDFYKNISGVMTWQLSDAGEISADFSED